jgi:hypothetical protein
MFKVEAVIVTARACGGAGRPAFQPETHHLTRK